VEDQVRDGIYREAIQPALRTYLTGLREKAYIDIAPGFVDTGASAKQTKPEFAASALPTVKKKRGLKSRLERGHAVAGPTASAAGSAAGTAGSAAVGAKPGAAGAATPAAGLSSAKTKTVAAGKKHRKIRREKIRFGQAPRNSLPATPEEAVVAGEGPGPSAASGALSSTDAAIAPVERTTTVAADEEPLAPTAERKKTRYSDRAPIEDKARRDAAKAAKAKEKAASTPVALTAEEKAKQQAQNAPLGLGGDTATKKKKQKRAKGAAKERLQEQAPAPPKPKPEATPIPPRSVRENGEPVVSPPPAVPAVTAPADAQPSAPAK
jgi:peptidyl-prolyl cis-trans isomerase SurA